MSSNVLVPSTWSSTRCSSWVTGLMWCSRTKINRAWWFPISCKRTNSSCRSFLSKASTCRAVSKSQRQENSANRRSQTLKKNKMLVSQLPNSSAIKVLYRLARKKMRNTKTKLNLRLTLLRRDHALTLYWWIRRKNPSANSSLRRGQKSLQTRFCRRT